jgi:predicted nucleotidyltransferase
MFSTFELFHVPFQPIIDEAAKAFPDEMTLLQQMTRDRAASRERMRRETRREIEAALHDLAIARTVVVFGSLVKPGGFSDVSDVDLALESEPAGMTLYQLTSLLAERLGRPVDIVLLPECRFRESILREGERWTRPV